ncbi:MAG: DUF4886 domain-containing protein, partial [Polyangia bacterium]
TVLSLLVITVGAAGCSSGSGGATRITGGTTSFAGTTGTNGGSISRTGPGAPVTVLFVGNSFTYVNDLPGHTAAIARSLGNRVDVAMAAPAGYTWEQHAQDAHTRAKILERAWDFVVLQEQSQRPDWPAFQLRQSVIPFALELDQLARQERLESHSVFFETWGHRDGDRFNCAHFPETCSYEGMQRLLSATYAQIANRTEARLAPVGTAWREVRMRHPEIVLYAGDGIHPSRQGTYLAACVIYVTLFKKPVVGADNLGLPVSEAQVLQRAAQQTVFHR